MNIVVSIVEFNTVNLLKKCLDTLFNKKWKNNLAVWVVDNASSDNSVEMVEKNFPKVNIIKSEKNVGFGAGHNIVFKKVKADYFIVLNSDTEIEDDIFDGMVDFMEQNKTCGISSCKVIGFDGKLQPNGGDLPFGKALINWLFNLDFMGGESFHRNDKEYYSKSHEVGWVSGNFMVIRKEIIEKLGGFDESYFMYFEDVDLCFRAKKAGFKVMINPGLSIKHLSGGSLDNPKLRQWGGEFKGLIKFYEYHRGKLAGILIRLFVYFGITLRMIAFAIKGNLSYSLNYAKIITNI